MNSISSDKIICLISLWYSPGHLDHLYAIASMFEGLGYTTFIYLNGRYRDMGDSAYKAVYQDEAALPNADLYLIWNTSTEDWRLLRKYKRALPASKWAFVYHEPYKGLARTVERFGLEENNWRDVLKTVVRHMFTKPLLTNVDLLVFPSQTAFDEYSSRCPSMVGKCTVLPLPYLDKCPSFTEYSRDFFSFIATASPDKAFDRYLRFIEKAASGCKDIKFQIVTRSPVRQLLSPVLIELERDSRLVIKEGRDLDSSEIDEAFMSSFCCWFAYNRSNQSGALCKSLMFGTPVIYTNVGSFPSVVGTDCGALVESNEDCNEILAAVQAIRSDFDRFSASARRRYLELFDSKGLARLYETGLLNRLV